MPGLAGVLGRVREECQARGVSALVAAADVTDAGAADAAFQAAVRAFDSLDSVVHSAAALAYGRFEDVPADVFDRSVGTTVGGTANVARSALASFAGSGGGRLVVLGSLLGRITTPYMSSYVTASGACTASCARSRSRLGALPARGSASSGPGVSTRRSTSRPGGEVVNSAANVMTPRPASDALHGRWGRHWLRPVTTLGAVPGAATILRSTRKRT